MGGNDTLVAGYYTYALEGGDGDDLVDGRNSQYLKEVNGDGGNDVILSVAIPMLLRMAVTATISSTSTARASAMAVMAMTRSSSTTRLAIPGAMSSRATTATICCMDPVAQTC